MRAVSNTTPLRYLIAIEHEHLLGNLFEKVFVSAAVYEELTDPRTPENVTRRLASLPPWLEVRTVDETHRVALPAALHRGERQAILLAESLQVDVLLIDEQTGRSVARGREIPISGTLGVLERADTLGFVADFPRVLRRIKASGFFIADVLEQELLARHRTRRSR